MAILEKDLGHEVDGGPGAPVPRKFNVDEYHAMGERGILLPDERTELLDGVVQIRGTGLPRKFTRDEYRWMDRMGILQADERTELINGEVYTRMTFGPPHVFCVGQLLTKLIAYNSSDSFAINMSPLVLTDSDEPEPDIMIMRGTLRDYESALATMRDVLLAIEVAVSSRARDLSLKARLYADSRVPEYWVVDLRKRELVIHEKPVAGKGYSTVRRVKEDGSLAPACKPEAVILLADILPSAEKSNASRKRQPS